MGRPSGSNATREPYVHWIFGSYKDFEFPANVLPTEAQVIQRFLFLKESRHGNYLAKENKNKIISEIADELKEIWSDSSNSLMDIESIRRKISNLITKAFEKDNNKTYYKNTPNYIEKQLAKHNVCFSIASTKRVIEEEDAENKREKLEIDAVSSNNLL